MTLDSSREDNILLEKPMYHSTDEDIMNPKVLSDLDQVKSYSKIVYLDNIFFIFKENESRSGYSNRRDTVISKQNIITSHKLVNLFNLV